MPVVWEHPTLDVAPVAGEHVRGVLLMAMAVAGDALRGGRAHGEPWWRRAAGTVLASIVLVLIGLALSPATAEATTYTVTKVADTNDANCDADCSLREAINFANFFPGPHVIQFASNPAGCAVFPCEIVLGSPLPTITRSFVTLDGFSAPVGQIKLSGNNAAFLGDGLSVQANSVTIRGFWIYGFNGNGIKIDGDDNVIVGNYVGDVTGAVSNNATAGISISSSARTRVGGSTSTERNVVSGNTTGIIVQTSTDTTIVGNYVGTHWNGQSAQSNLSSGIRVSNSSGTAMGGTAAGERNVISGNGSPDLSGPGHGIELFAATNTLIRGNAIGLAADGTTAIGNEGDGVSITGNSQSIVVGGLTTALANQIAFNSGAGIRCFRSTGSDPGCTGGHFPINSIFTNTGLGIDLDAQGITTNDLGDGDTGPNGLQNFPIVSSVGVGGGKTVIAGSLTSRPNRTYNVYFYTQAGCDISGNGEGRTILASTSFTTDGVGSFSFNVTAATAVAAGTFVTALAIDDDTLDTSEFSACQTALSTGFVVTPTSGLQTTEAGGQATFTVRLTTLPSAQVHIVPSSSDATEGSVGPSHLTFTPVNARFPQTVTVTGLPDDLVDGNVPFTVILAAATSTDPGYNGLNPTDVSVTNLDGPSCSSKPRVTTSVVPESDERLRVTLTANGSNNKLTLLQVQSTANSEIEVPLVAPRSGAFDVVLNDLPSYSFVIHRLQPAQPATVKMIVTDKCGSWPTLAGGGVNGFP